MKKTTKLIFSLAAMLVSLVCLASCDQLLENGIITHKHEYGAWENDTATCESDGVQTRVCKSCRDVQTRETKALGHDFVSYKDREPDCTEYGHTNYSKCIRCDSYEGELIDPLGHTFLTWGNNTATCLKGGNEESLCEVCGVKERRPTEALGHSIDSDGICENCKKSDIVTLFENGRAKFNLVVTAGAGGNGMATADMFVERLRVLGVHINDVVMDTDSSAIANCEIIVGTGASGRGEECAVLEKEVGAEGQLVKIVGKRVIIAGGTPALTVSAFDKFVKETLGITDKTKSVGYIEVDSSCCYNSSTDYVIDSIKIAGEDLENYEYVFDVSGLNGYDFTDINKFHDDLFTLSGYWLNYVPSVSMTQNGKYFIIRYVEDAGENGFRAYVDGDDFIVECAYKNMFNNTFRDFANETFLSKSGEVEIPADFTYEKKVNVVYYEDFGAVGDGETCDYEAIYNAHVFANSGGQKVLSKLGAAATYYISPDKFNETIPIKTNVDFCGATFIVDDVGESAYANRKLALFTLARDYSEVIYKDSEKNVTVLDSDGNPVLNEDGSVKMTTDKIIDDPRFKDVKIAVGQTDFSWLSCVLSGKSLVKIENKLHKDFIRHGANQNSGATRKDIFVVNADGTVDPDSAPVFAFDNISTIEIYRADEKPITVENGHFINICCQTVESTKYVINGADDDKTNDIETTHACKFHEYQRGFIVNRSNATIKNVTHRMEDEPTLGWYPEGCGYTPDSKHANYGSRHESYPYYGFVFVSHSYNFKLTESELTGHMTYYEDKPATASTGWEIPNPVPMGTYDFVLEYSSNIHFNDVIQATPTDLTDVSYWGIMSSNGTKNLNFTGCRINRFDAHRGFWNATIKDTYIGHSFQIIGGGTLLVENVTKAAKNNFISMRGDYGATFDGDIILKNCTYEGRKEFYSARNQSPSANGAYTDAYIISSGFATSNSGYSTADYSGGYWLWDFGYTCYMPANVTIDNFTHLSKNMYVFNNLPNTIFVKTYVEGVTPTINTVRYPYQITKSITQKNMPKLIPNCKSTGTNYSKLREIPVKSENIG
ncbi:MAG: hypothetical protein E7673_01260 [Ruminococcaceae bacterium]|nr:hypothetical protein [Oscillospiraceae bacterium]